MQYIIYPFFLWLIYTLYHFIFATYILYPAFTLFIDCINTFFCHFIFGIWYCISTIQIVCTPTLIYIIILLSSPIPGYIHCDILLVKVCKFCTADAFENVGYVGLLQTGTHISNENFPSCFIIYRRFSESVIVAPPHRLPQSLGGIYHPKLSNLDKYN